MPEQIPLPVQTTYAELLERAATAAFEQAFEEQGSFISKTVRGRKYWYFQTPTDQGRTQKYVGPETPELLDRISKHRQVKISISDRQALVASLVRSKALPAPIKEIGDVIETLAKAGVFRLRGVLVGTVAYQTYPAMLGRRLSGASGAVEISQTDDIDIAQFADVSIAVGDKTEPMLDVLRARDPSFRPVSHIHDPRRIATYLAANGIRVDFLTPMKGPNTDAPGKLPALQTDAQQLRYLDFLIFATEAAVLLHGAGIYVDVPAPERYAIHKLIVSQMRPAGSAKAEKDLKQAEALIDVLCERRPVPLQSCWKEAVSNGRNWRQMIGGALGQIRPLVRDRLLKLCGTPRSFIAGLRLEFSAPAARYDGDREMVTFLGTAMGKHIRCAIPRETLEDHFHGDGLEKDALLKITRDNRALFERMAQRKYMEWPIDDLEILLIRTDEFDRLRSESDAAQSIAKSKD